MSGAGHVIDMNNRMRQNRSMTSSNRQKFQGSNRELDFSIKNTTELSFKVISEKELAGIKNTIRSKAKASQRREVIIFSGVLLSALIVLIYCYTKYVN
ncbi:hypothetical protein MWU65_03745 [Cellulophaga sp. F20128]|uniref:hypothetical protein n=1 Tax=Cellulophaga sp. F20128 TaxID=2926413 RepID=UPI001FF5022E|nr:hypothetical protein [Cellulophaga sp. F20128]MCK0156277.1 hypothetical protein [Cellulophaga sp. F20128]